MADQHVWGSPYGTNGEAVRHPVQELENISANVSRNFGMDSSIRPEKLPTYQYQQVLWDKKFIEREASELSRTAMFSSGGIITDGIPISTTVHLQESDESTFSDSSENLGHKGSPCMPRESTDREEHTRNCTSRSHARLPDVTTRAPSYAISESHAIVTKQGDGNSRTVVSKGTKLRETALYCPQYTSLTPFQPINLK